MKEKEKSFDKGNIIFNVEKMTKQSIGKHQISKNELSKKRILQERGITLIALVVTIIILLILAGVTLNMALSQNGLFSKTQDAAEKYKQAQSDEEEMVRQIATQMYSEYVGATVTGYTPTSKNEGCTVENDVTGYENSQTFKTDEMEWKVWDFDGNTLRIIGDPTSEKLYLKGATGYNNGVYAMDYICKELYSNEGAGAIATNLKKTDIQKVSTYDYTKYKHGADNTELPDAKAEDTIQFGETRSYNNAKYPEMWNLNDKNWKYEWNDSGVITEGDKECTIWEKIGDKVGNMEKNPIGGNDRQTFKQSCYRHEYQQSEFINDKYFDIIFEKSDDDSERRYFLSSRYVFLYKDYCTFGFQRIDASEAIHEITAEGMTRKYRGKRYDS